MELGNGSYPLVIIWDSTKKYWGFLEAKFVASSLCKSWWHPYFQTVLGDSARLVCLIQLWWSPGAEREALAFSSPRKPALTSWSWRVRQSYVVVLHTFAIFRFLNSIFTEKENSAGAQHVIESTKEQSEACIFQPSPFPHHSTYQPWAIVLGVLQVP